MISEKKSVQHLHRFCLDLGIDNWVISPGSRNAPITLTLANDERFKTIAVVDERSAAFIALGKSLRLESPVAITCTSGSAALNYAPAIAEAYYQEVPLLIVTADRPQKWIDNGEGQSINQVGVFDNYCLASFHVNDSDSEQTIRSIFEGVQGSLFGNRKGPVHLNLAFEEPLYNKVEEVTLKEYNRVEPIEEKSKLNHLIESYLTKTKVMVLVGQMHQDEQLDYLLGELLVDKRLVVLTETTANLSNFKFIDCIDRTLPSFKDGHYQPELVITVGGAIISKRIKKFLRSIDDLEHWHLSEGGNFPDTFEVLSEKVKVSPAKFFRELFNKLIVDETHGFQNLWFQRSKLNEGRHDEYVKNISWSDLKVHEMIHQFIPDGSVLHQGNSSVVRYFQLFNTIDKLKYLSNRGVSGIDGIVSTAVGFASEDDRLNVVVVGDLSFQYDINAFWNKLPKQNLLIIVVNNGGGGIFKIIEGPSSTGVLDDYFEVGSKASVEKLAAAFEVNYGFAIDSESFENHLESAINDYAQGTFCCKILEADTRAIASHEVLRKYFQAVNPQ